MGTCSEVTVTLLHLLLAGAGAALVVLGCLNLDHCPVEESLPVWMIVAGCSSILVTLVCGAYSLCLCRRGRGGADDDYYASSGSAGYYATPEKVRSRPQPPAASSPKRSSSHTEGFGHTLCALAAGFAAGAALLVFLLFWVALWTAGTYLTAAAVGEVRVEKLARTGQEWDQELCDVPSVIVSLCSVILVWSLLAAAAVWSGCAIYKAASGGHRSDRGKRSQNFQQNIYDQVPAE